MYIEPTNVLSKVEQVLIKSFPSPKPVVIPKLKNPISSTIYP